MNKIGILGMGQVGKALSKIYKKNKIKVIVKDIIEVPDFKYFDILNICIPYTNKFIDNVVDETIKTQSKYVIIHSTVPVGVTQKIQSIIGKKHKIVHSPVRGNHNNLVKSILTFKKYIGSPDKKTNKKIKKHFNKLKIKSVVVDKFEITELLKLLCTTYYGLCIAWHGEMDNYFKYFNLDFNYFTCWNKSYNDGYLKLKQKKFIRPILYPPQNRKIKGNCVVPNIEILNSIHKNQMLDFILNYK